MTITSPSPVEDRWTPAYNAEVDKIEHHQRFTALIREVAVAEQSDMPGYNWLRRNSRTYGMWVHRGMPYQEKERRARLLAKEIALDLCEPELAALADSNGFRELEAKVYVIARIYVRARRLWHEGKSLGRLAVQ